MLVSLAKYTALCTHDNQMAVHLLGITLDMIRSICLILTLHQSVHSHQLLSIQ